MKILFWLQKILAIRFLQYADDDQGGSEWWNQDGSDGINLSNENWSDESWNNGWSENWNSQEDKYKRYQISQAKKEAVNKVLGNDEGNDQSDPKQTFSKEDLLKDDEFRSLLDGMVNERLGEAWLDKISKIDEFSEKLERDSFFNQFEKAWSDYASYWMDISPDKWGQIMADIEEKWFTPQQAMLLANEEFIIWKLKGMPRSPMSTDSGQSFKAEKGKMSMMDYVKRTREKYSNN